VSSSDTRDLLVAAVRRDLYGPVGSADVTWPGAKPSTLSRVSAFESRRDVAGVFVDSENNEILFGSPLRRYGIGILFPQGLTRNQEEALDTAQADVAHEAADIEAVTADIQLEPPPEFTDAAASAHADSDDAAETEPDDPWRPRSMAVSFLVGPGTNASLRIEVTGGWYEPMALDVAGSPATFWRRRPLAVSATVAARADSDVHHDLVDGPLQLRVGTVYRPHQAGTIVTVYVLNRTPAGPDLFAATAASLFQANLMIRAPEEIVVDYPGRDVLVGDDRTLDLLYHRQPVRAVGHGCNARASVIDGEAVVIGDHYPVEVVHSPVPDAIDETGNVLAVDMDGLAGWNEEAQTGVDAILDAYAAWIDRRRDDIAALSPGLHDVARLHIEACAAFHTDATEGWHLAKTNPEVARILRWTSQAMADQRRAYGAQTRPLRIVANKVVGARGASPHAPSTRRPARWRAFQLAFLLASLPAIVDPDDRRASTVDIIWMPTGGGKTEAYSAVAAFTMLWRRFHQVRTGAVLGGQGATVLMRYTLRLLTAQQLQRAAALICALEQLRRSHPDQLGDKRKFTVGAWLGRRSTPNDWSGARVALHGWRADATKRGFLLTRCPWCAAAIGRRAGPGSKEVDGYKTVAAPNTNENRVMAYCPDPACPFNDDNQTATAAKPQGLPVYEVDADLYQQPPTFIVATVDKFAMLAWRTEPACFFGLRNAKRTGPGPTLLIQDELHLISGPLGSLDALYEPILEDLCSRDGGTVPRIVAATATTRRYRQQTAALYGRSHTRLIPPPGLDAEDNFFSRTDPASAGRIFVGVCAPGFGKAQEAQIRVLAALGHAGGSLDVVGRNADPWWTNLCFFSSRRSLGLVQSLCQTHLRGHSWRLRRATGVDAGPTRSTGTRLTMRSMTSRVELTAQATGDVSEAMERLTIPYTDKLCADMCLATSMIEVGVDIDRLGLLTMFGQPKSASQYIQVAGRVGRDEGSAPGVVFVVLSPYSSRDRSHFEQFSTFHRRLYASVEPVSITPYTPAALDRGLAGALTTWLRQAANPASPADANARLGDAVAPLEARVVAGSPQQRNLRRRFDELALHLASTTHPGWGILRPGRDTGGFLRPLGDEAPPNADSPGALNTTWLVPTSMRSVDSESGARAIYHMKSATALTAPTDRADSEEDLI